MTEQELYTLKYTGPFGFIKPWSAVRDELTFSERYLPPATVQGISQKLFGLGEAERIKRYRLKFDMISEQQEVTWAVERKKSKKKKQEIYGQTVYGDVSYNNGIITRGLLLKPQLVLGFSSPEDAEIALAQHICLCRNEDILLPDRNWGDNGIRKLGYPAFEQLKGFEALPCSSEDGVPAGRNRYLPGAPMTFVELKIQE